MQTEKIIIKNGGKYQKVSLNKVLYCTSAGTYTIIKTESEEFSAAQNLKRYEEDLLNKGFCRISRYHLLNMHHCNEIETTNIGTYALLSNGEKVKVSVRKRSEVLRYFRSK